MSNQKVSIIVPIYNAEQYLGNTITSIIRQTYKNIEIILVNDGSKDGSLQICRNYAAIDDRIKIIDMPNGGVSAARNKGIDEATGVFIQFVDSDDYIAENMTERLVEAQETYQTDLVVCGMQYVELNDRKIVRQENWMPNYLGRECVLSQKMFLKDFSAILLYTVLLEGPCNKLYKRDYFEKYKLSFPLDIELGEDFLLNLQYFDRMKNIVFISEILYFYLQRHEGSLTKCYRENMFQNQKILLDKYRRFLEKNIAWKGNNVRLFYEYAVGHVINCLKSTVDDRNEMTEKEIKSEIYKILGDESTALWIEKAPWIEEGYQWLRDCIKTTDVGFTYMQLKEIEEKRKWNINHQLMQENEQQQGQPNSGKLNIIIVYILRNINKVFQKEKIRKTIVSLENDGIKITMSRIKDFFER